MRSSSPSAVEKELREVVLAHRAGNLPLAESLVEKLLSSHPDRADVHMAKGMLLRARGDLEGCLQWLDRSVRTDPSNAEALSWATHVSLSLQRYAEAEAYARRFAARTPNNPQAHFLLATALRGLGRTAEALEAVDRSLAIQPEDPESLVLKARLLKSYQFPALATEFYRRAMAIRPTPPAAIDLAQTLLRESHPQEALEMLETVMPLIPETVRPYDLIARAQTALLRFEEAAVNWELAERFLPDTKSVAQSHAKAEIAAGRFEIAEALLVRGLNDPETAASSFALLSTSRKMKADDLQLAERMEAMIATGAVSSAEVAKLHFSLGKTFDDLRDYERAMGHFDDANRITYEHYCQHSSFSQEEARHHTDFHIAYFNQNRIRNLAKTGLESWLPLFVLGMARSGTTLTESILSAHSAVKAGGEQAFWSERAIEFFKWERWPVGLKHELALTFAQDFLNLLDPKSDDCRHVIDKNPSNFQLSGLLHCLFPNAKIVHLKRHPVDNLLSMWMTPFGDEVGYISNRENMAFVYREYLRQFRHFQEVLPPDRFATFSYEELTSHPEPTITSLLDHVGLQPEPACFAPEKNARTVLTPSVLQVRQPINRRSQARWRNYAPWLGEFEDFLEDADRERP